MSEQLPLVFDEGTIQRSLNVEVPPLPSVIRYIDDFTEEQHSINDLSELRWSISINGNTALLKFDRYTEDRCLQLLIQAFVADLLIRWAPATARLRLTGLVHFSLNDLINVIECDPTIIRSLWDKLRAKNEYVEAFVALKSLLIFLSERRVGQWRPAYLTFISSSLPLPAQDKFAAVRRGDVFLSVEDESKIVRWIEKNALACQSLTLHSLVDTAILICNYQFAMRPKQIGTLRRRDCRVIGTSENKNSVHLSFRMLKQHDEMLKRLPLVRRVKREWAAIIGEIYKRNSKQPGEAHLFGYVDALSISVRIRELLLEITGTSWSATDLRHSGAMRMVDAGASAEELAEFMGHSSLESGQVYYATSATQAERVNQALGISETYRQVALIGERGFISPDELLALKGEMQVAGAPHGMPIAGIGACTTGQPSCPFNPVMACYGCPKFLPVADESIHNEVLNNFRDVVNFYYSASRAESVSPAYLQLKRTIAEVQTVITQLGKYDEC